MRTLLILIGVLAIAFSTASAQMRGVLVMHVGPAPEYRMSIGIAAPRQDRLFVQARIEFAPDCSPAGVAALDVTNDQVFPLTHINPGETPAQYGQAHLAAYEERVAALGGTSTPEYRECVLRMMTQQGERQLERRG